MSFFSTDIILFSVFLAVNLIVGLLAGRRVRSLRDFSIGNKDFTTATVTSTIVATWIGGGFMFYGLQNIYTNGLLFIIPLLGSTLCLLFTGQVLAIRMGEFLNNLSVAEAMGDLYGPTVRVITAISGILRSIGSIAIQFQVIAKMLTLLLGVKGPWVTITAASIVILYSAFGGIRSVIITDLFQFIAFVIFIPILALVAWNHLKNPGQVAATLSTNPIFNLKEIIGWNPEFLTALGLLLYFAIPGMAPAIFQRVTIAKDLEQVKKSFTYAAGITLLVNISVAWVAILLLSDNPNLEPNSLVNYIIAHYAYPGLKGFIAIGITAMAMSTADSYLNSSAVLAVNDIIKTSKFPWKDSLTLVRTFSLIFGIFGLLLALYIKDFLQLLLLSGSFYMPIVTVPFLLAILGFRSTTKAVLIGMSAGFITVAFWDKLLGHTGMGSIIPGMLANLVFYIGSHYGLRQKGGWVGIKDPYPLLAARQERRDAWKPFKQAMNLFHLPSYLYKSLPTREVVYLLTAIYILLSTYLGFYFLNDHLVASYPKLQYFIFQSVIIIIAVLVTYPLWNTIFKKPFIIISTWYLSILYICFFLSTLLVLFSGLQQEFLFIFIGNILIASFVLPFPIFLGMFLFGLPVAWFTFKSITGVTTLPTGFNFWQFKVIYTFILLGSSLAIIFNIRNKYAREKAQSKRLKLEKLEAQLTAKIFNLLQDKSTSYQTEINAKQVSLLDVEKVMLQMKSNVEQICSLHLNTTLNEKLAIEQFNNIFTQCNYMFQRLADKLSLSLTKVPPDELINQALEMYRESVEDTNSYPEIVVKYLTTFKKTECDVEKLKMLLSSTLERVQMHNPTKKRLIVRVEDTMIVYKIQRRLIKEKREKALKITITTFNVPVDEKDFYVAHPINGIESTSLSDISESTLIRNLRILDSHYGYMGTEINTATDYQQFYVLPIKVAKLIKSKRLYHNWMITA
jgi:Na+/proline symporter